MRERKIVESSDRYIVQYDLVFGLMNNLESYDGREKSNIEFEDDQPYGEKGQYKYQIFNSKIEAMYFIEDMQLDYTGNEDLMESSVVKKVVKEITMTKDYLVEVVNESGVAEEMILRKDNTYSFETETPEVETPEIEEACSSDKKPMRNPRNNRRPQRNPMRNPRRRPMETPEENKEKEENEVEVKVEVEVEGVDKMPRRRPQMNNSRRPQNKRYRRDY